MSNGLVWNRCCHRMLDVEVVRFVRIGWSWKVLSTGIGRVSRGVIYRNGMDRGKPCGSAIIGTRLMARGIVCWPGSWLKPMHKTPLIGMFQWTPRSTGPISMARIPPGQISPRGAFSNHKNLPIHEVEPAGHGLGRSRGGLSTKIHFAVDGNGRPLSIVVTGGQRHDGAMLPAVLGDIRVPRLGPGGPRTRPDTVLADRGYTSAINRNYLRSRGISAVIPEKSNEISTRKRKGRKGGRPPAFNPETYKHRNVVERAFGLVKQWRGIATRYDKHAVNYRGGVVLAAVLTWLRI